MEQIRATEKLSRMAQELLRLVEQFKIAGDAEAKAVEVIPADSVPATARQRKV